VTIGALNASTTSDVVAILTIHNGAVLDKVPKSKIVAGAISVISA